MKQVATKESVWTACRELAKDGEEITTRKVVARVGGSSSTVGPLIRQFMEHQLKERTLNYTISDELRNTLIDELHRVVTGATGDLERALRNSQSDNLEIFEDLTVAEDKIDVLERDIANAELKAEELSRVMEKNLVAAEQKIEVISGQLNCANQEKQDLQNKLSACQSELAKAHLLAGQSDQTVQSLNEQNRSLQEKAETTQALLHELEKQHETAKARWEYAQARQQELTSELDMIKQRLDDERERRITAENKLTRFEAMGADQISTLVQKLKHEEDNGDGGFQ
ncbi:replication region DNA-binding N-term [Malonomonas rubra DSM 5091]|uniref:Replication region DNA-binding N-term n=1 Tax=Malonomonas rubra DSM 5091 TaxID=1122189 RepID=A0A1M6L5C4_MALRU|nr:DNA-binding protein [Malonomonas rubra]SHJ66415.1 replication region DNA-binding N-term [Malonomonas rubra DSM 5091]